METCELIKLWKNGDKAARDKVVEVNMGLVYSIARRFCGRGVEYEDLVQLGALGLIKAVDNFNLDYEVKFSTYAVPVITGEIKRFLRDDGLVKVSRSIKENYIKISKELEAFNYEKGYDASIDDIVTITGISREDVVMALEASKLPKSINEEMYDSSDSSVTLGDMLVNSRDDYEEVNRKVFLKTLLNKLDEFQCNLIRLRYFEDKTQMEVAKLLNISQVQVSRHEKRILLYLRSLV